MFKRKIGDTLFIITEFGDLELVCGRNSLIITKPIHSKLIKNEKLFYFLSEIKYEYLEKNKSKTSILIIEKKLFYFKKSKI